MQYSAWPVRWTAAAAIALCSATAAAEVTCEQLGQLALSTERLRDQGYPLAQIKGDIDGLVANGKFSAEESVAIQKSVNDAFLRIRTSNEIVVECVAKAKK